MFKAKSLGLVLVQGLTLLTAQDQETQDVKGRQAQFWDILEVVSVDSAMLSSVLKLNLVLPHCTCVDVGLWNTDQNFVDYKPAIEWGGFYMAPNCSEGH